MHVTRNPMQNCVYMVRGVLAKGLIYQAGYEWLYSGTSVYVRL